MATTTKISANNEFIGACLTIDELLATISALRANHFGVDTEAQRNWGEVGSARFVRDRLREAVRFLNGAEG